MKKMTVSVEQEQYDRILDRVESNVADNRSEALRQELRGERAKTQTRKIIDRIGKVFGICGLFLIGATYFFPVEYRLAALFPIVLSISFFIVGWAIDCDYEVKL